MPLAAGTRVGPYEIHSAIGAGGMGEVFRARDTKLNRDVALKVLPDLFADDPERLARFEREAQALASVNHPNIAQIHGLEDSGTTRCIVMELVDGETLAERLQRGPLALDETLSTARQICEALEAAHEKGIIHRDLKPANVKIRPDGTVKLLDFGLARLFDAETGSIDPSLSPAIETMPRGTTVGVILGTAAYMSPEQARGKAVDKRTDIWSFGCVLFEMLTGQQFFGGETVSDSIAKVLERQPDLNLLPAGTPPGIAALVRRALQKDRKHRLQDIGDARIEIEEALRGPASTRTTHAAHGRERFAWSLVAILALSTIAATVLWLRSGSRSDRDVSAIRFNLTLPGVLRDMVNPISPDGRMLAFVTLDDQNRRSLWIQPLDAVVARRLEGTEDATWPFWSPDSRSIGFFAQGRLKRVDVAGGLPRTVCDGCGGAGGTWNQNDVILFGGRQGIRRVDASGGTPTTILAAPDSTDFLFPYFLPDGRHFLYVDESETVFVGSVDSSDAQRLMTGADVPVIYTPPGYLVFVRDATLMAQPFDAATLRLGPRPFPIATGFGALPYQAADISGSQTGALVYRASGSWTTKLSWFDRSGKKLSDEPVEGIVQAPNLSRDGKRVALERTDTAGKTDIWILDLLRGTNMRLTLDGGSTRPFFSPGGDQVVFGRNEDFYQKSAGGIGAEERLDKGEPTDWSPDGESVLFIRGGDLWHLPLKGDRKAVAVVTGSGNDRRGRFSPDGKWIAYETNESGRFEIYVQKFPPTRDRWQISANGGNSAWWRSDGKELFFASPDRKLMSVDLKMGATIEASAPKVLFEIPGVINNSRFVASLDGQKFLLPLITGAQAAPSTVVLNWPASLK